MIRSIDSSQLTIPFVVLLRKAKRYSVSDRKNSSRERRDRATRVRSGGLPRGSRVARGVSWYALCVLPSVLLPLYCC